MERAKAGVILPAELAKIASTLEASSPSLELYPLLYAIGRSQATRYRKIVERFLYCESEPDLARLALQILCDFWRNTERYLEDVKRFARGLPWDSEEQVRLMAIFIAGEYLRDHQSRELLGYLISVCEDRNQSRFAQEDAYRALARAVGRDWTDLPSAARHFDLEKDTDPKVLVEARRRHAREK
jgi:hypothetical protein